MDKEVRKSALDGLMVLDISRVLAGPYAGQILGDHGADIVKVEAFTGDDTRGYGPPFVRNDASYFLGLNRNKRGIAVDLSQQAGQQILFNLIERADVLIENFRSSTWRKWGVSDFSDFRKGNPGLVHCRITGFGDDGELAGMPGYDAALQALTGLMSINGTEDSGPTRLGVPIIDISTGLNAAIGILLALHERTNSGQGQMIEVSLFDTALGILHPHSSNVLAGGQAQRTGNLHPNIYPYDLFSTRTVDLYIAVGTDRQFAYLCEALGKPELPGDPDFHSNRKRVGNRDRLKSLLNEQLSQLDGEALFQDLLKRGVPCAPLYTIEQALNLSQTKTRQMVVEIDDYKVTGIPIKLERSPGTIRLAPPHIGEHTDMVLGRLGLNDHEIQTLFKSDVVR